MNARRFDDDGWLAEQVRAVRTARHGGGAGGLADPAGFAGASPRFLGSPFAGGRTTWDEGLGDLFAEASPISQTNRMGETTAHHIPPAGGDDGGVDLDSPAALAAAGLGLAMWPSVKGWVMWTINHPVVWIPAGILSGLYWGMKAFSVIGS